MRGFFVSFVTLVSLGLSTGAAYAQVSLQEFAWRANGRFEAKLTLNGAAVVLRGDLRDNEKAQAKKDQLTLDLRSYVEGFVFAVATLESEDLGYVFLMERQNADYVVMNAQAIRGRKLTLVTDIEGIVTGLKKVNKWDVSLAMRWMVEYSAANAKKQVHEIFDAVELGHAKSVPKPKTNTRDPMTTPAQSPQSSDRTDQVQSQPMDITPSGQRQYQQPYPQQQYQAPQYQQPQYQQPQYQRSYPQQNYQSGNDYDDPLNPNPRPYFPSNRYPQGYQTAPTYQRPYPQPQQYPQYQTAPTYQQRNPYYPQSQYPAPQYRPPVYNGGGFFGLFGPNW